MIKHTDTSLRTHPMDEGVYLAVFAGDPEEARRQYADLRRRLIFFFVRWACADPEQLADETISRALANLAGGKPVTTSLGAYCYGIARNVRLEAQHEHQFSELISVAASELRNP